MLRMVPLLLRNLTRNKRRTILTILSIAVSVFVFAALISLPSLVAEVLRDRANSLRVITQSKAGFLYEMPEAYGRRIESIPHVEAVSGYDVFLGTYRDPNMMVPAVALDADRLQAIFPDWTVNETEQRDFVAERSAALVHPDLMKRYRWKLGDQIIIHGTNYPIDLQLKVVGTTGGLAPPGGIVFRRDYMEEVLGRPGKVNVYWVKVDSSANKAQVMADVDRTFANSASETMTSTEAEVIKSRIGSQGLLLNGAKALALIVVFTIGLVAFNTAAMAVRERRSEIAVMRAIGFTRRAIVASIVTEGLLIGVLGGVLGVLMARAGFMAIPYAARALGPVAMALKLSPPVIANSFVVAMLIGALSALIPAWLATRGDVSGSLRAVV